MKKTTFGRACWSVLLLALICVWNSKAFAERPIAPKLLPETTLVFVRVASAPELVQAFEETSLGKISQNEQIKPLIGQLYGSAAQAFAQIQDEIGSSLDELLALPQGEVCVAFVARPGARPAIAAIIDVGDQIKSARKLLARGDELAADRGLVKNTETVGEVELTVYEGLPNGGEACVFEKEQTIVIAGSVPLAEQILARWDGQAGNEDRTLADNRKFLTIMNRSKGTKDERPQITWYVDPIQLVEETTGRSGAGAAALAFLPVLGLDGFLAAGGSFILAPEDFDGIVHIHVLLDNPRAGVIEMLALTSGDTTPEPWVPGDVASYTTLNWDIEKTYSKLESLVDSFNYDGLFADTVDLRISERIGVEFKKDVIDALEGRVSYVTAFIEPVRVNGQATLIGAKLKDAASFRRTLDKIRETIDRPLEKKLYAGVTYYQADEPLFRRRPRRRRDDQQDQPQQPPASFREPEPCLAIIGDYLVMSDSGDLLRQAIKTKNDADQSLARQLDFELIASKIKRQMGDKKAGLITFSRPEQSVRQIYNLATDEQMRKNLADRADDNEFFSVLHDALQDNPLPPFSELEKHLAPGGGMIVNDETGFHYMGFTLKRE